MSRFVLAPAAEEDIFEIWCYLAKEVDVSFVDRVEKQIFDAFAVLSASPGSGHRREDLTPNPVLFFRVFPHQYLIIYKPGSPLEVVGVLHAKRDLSGILFDRGI